MKKIERTLESIIFNSRWLLAPFYLGLVLAIGLLLVKFAKELAHLVPVVFTGGGEQVIIGILSLVDIALVANLLLIIVFAGYENFVSHIHTENAEDRPEWMGHVDFSDLKIKLIGSIVAISAIELLKAFVNMKEMTTDMLAWKVGIHLTLVVSGVLFAVMDRLGVAKKRLKSES
ncbi:MAG: TIGR00645 family protein [Nitrospirota bacterium]|nr:TIGR00645 family protein [Nitrospirota bacterium]